MKDFKELQVWQHARAICRDSLLLCRKLNTSHYFELSNQMSRSAISIPSNIAEGFGRRSDKEFVQFLRYSLGSIAELHTQWIICFDLGIISEFELSQIEERLRAISRMINNLINHLSKQK